MTALITVRDFTPASAREYLRVSKDASGRLRSAEEQREDNERAAGAEGWALGQAYVEAGAVSASRYGQGSRPGFAALIADLDAGRFAAQVLILWESSRGSRRLSEWTRFLELLEERGVLVHVTSHARTYDLSKPRDRRILQEDGVAAEAESAKISERVQRAIDANAERGDPHGRIPYGYCREYERGHRGTMILAAQVPDPQKAPVVRGIFRDISNGKTLRSIAAALNERGIPARHGGLWTVGAISAIGRNQSYGGIRVHCGKAIPGTWKPLVPLHRFYAVRAVLTDPKRRRGRPGNVRHLLTGIAACGVCGGGITFRHRWHDGREERTYTCRDGGHVHIPQDGLDEWVTCLVLGRLTAPGALATFSGDRDDPGAREAQDHLAALQARMTEMTDAMKHGVISPTAFGAAEPGLRDMITAAEKRVAVLLTPDAVLTLLEQSTAVETAWAGAEIRLKRAVVRDLFECVAVLRAPVRGIRGEVAARVGIRWRERPGRW